MKEPIAGSDKAVTLVIINQKQLKEALSFTLNTYLAQQKTVVAVALSTGPKEILKMVPEPLKKKIFIIDCFSQQAAEEKNIIFAGSPADLTNIQVALDSIEKEIVSEKVIIFDSVNVLSVYSSKEVFGKFMHLFSNKMLLKGNTTMLFTSKDATDEEILSMVKEFADKTYDFSDMLLTSMTQMQ